MAENKILTVGGIFGLEANKSAATVYVYGEPVRTYYRGRLKATKVYDDLVECFHKHEPYASKKLLRYLAVLIAGLSGMRISKHTRKGIL